MKKIVGIAMQVFAVVFWVQFVAIQLYDPASEGFGGLVWTIFDPFVAAGALITIYVGFRRKQDVDNAQEGGLTKEYFEANVTLYGGIILIHALLWNWIGSRLLEPEMSLHWLWIFIDISVPLLLFPVGRHLAKSGSAEQFA
ncbi:MAG: hypothetical protein OXF86_12700 [Caldilineaceae bacterium]|nr:hypothetical protein [Caldilineaceae bacterium]